MGEKRKKRIKRKVNHVIMRKETDTYRTMTEELQSLTSRWQ